MLWLESVLVLLLLLMMLVYFGPLFLLLFIIYIVSLVLSTLYISICLYTFISISLFSNLSILPHLSIYLYMYVYMYFSLFLSNSPHLQSLADQKSLPNSSPSSPSSSPLESILLGSRFEPWQLHEASLLALSISLPPLISFWASDGLASIFSFVTRFVCSTLPALRKRALCTLAVLLCWSTGPVGLAIDKKRVAWIMAHGGSANNKNSNDDDDFDDDYDDDNDNNDSSADEEDVNVLDGKYNHHLHPLTPLTSDNNCSSLFPFAPDESFLLSTLDASKRALDDINPTVFLISFSYFWF